jgi:ferredoxin
MAAVVDGEKCTACGLCEDVCPEQAITVDDVARADDNRCIESGLCVDVCPNDAISLPG